VTGLEDRPRSEATEGDPHVLHTAPPGGPAPAPRLGLSFSIWTLQRLADFLGEETGIRLSHETVRRLLKDGGVVLSLPQHKVTSPDSEYKLKKGGRAAARPPEARGGVLLGRRVQPS
jgi:transposase